MIQQQKIAIISIFINLLFITLLIYFYYTNLALKKVEVLKYANGKVAKRTEDITVTLDKNRPVKIQLIWRYYRTGSLRFEGCLINGNWDFCRTYSHDSGKLLSTIICGKGKVIIPDNDGKISPNNTFYPFETMNCYYRYGEPLTKQEYNRREKIQGERVSSLGI